MNIRRQERFSPPMSMQFARSAAAALALALAASAGRASDCKRTSIGVTPLNDLSAGVYLGQFQGGLYPGGLNQVPAVHSSAGLSHAQSITALDTLGNPSPTGKYILISIGMSNTTQEYCSAGAALPCASWSFMGQATNDPRVNHSTLALVNGAAGGQSAATWDSPTDPNYDRVRNNVLIPQGLSEAQVQAAWLKVANPQPTVSLPSTGSDAYTLVTQMGNICRALKVRYPNLKLVFVSSRIYAGYASTTLNPEPYAYESGFAVKWLIQAQINQMAGGPVDPRAGDLNYNTVAPWIAWGPYLWADGLTPRSDGLTWQCSNLDNDGTHPSQSGEQKVATMLLNFFLSSPHAQSWFPVSCYSNCDSSTAPPILNINDFTCFLNRYAAGSSYANCDGSSLPPILNVNDFQCFRNRYAAGCP